MNRRLNTGNIFEEWKLWCYRYATPIKYSFYAICIVLLIIGSSGCSQPEPDPEYDLSNLEDQIDALRKNNERLKETIKRARQEFERLQCTQGDECSI